MTVARLQPAGPGRWALVGSLNFGSVPAVWAELAKLIKGGGKLTVSLKKVDSTNSAGLVLLLEARDLARKSSCRLSLIDIPTALVDLASMSRAEHLIGRKAPR